MSLELCDCMQALYKSCAFAVVRTSSVERGCEIAEGLLKGGIFAMEISYTNNNASDVIQGIQAKFGDKMIVGAGTIMDAASVRIAQMAGARFIVSNCLREDVIQTCNRYQIPCAPGCTSVTEAIHALELGASCIKCFPISNVYGPQLVKLFKTPTPWMPLMASGGINLENIGAWLEGGIDFMGMGSLFTQGSLDEISENARKVRTIIDDYRSRV